ncbi:hypothetical protein [Streptomyces olivochromogenes]|uniref:hypothetical protein n=1 Tax=Streptomyces olivochromogenes TaxID=1963 RepID=UPI001F456939|nr:hypothetical protein [Streptomyces olivochromogenes]MCF3135717.1 hypothetical protein [Streptomyces olivochromogenes]
MLLIHDGETAADAPGLRTGGVPLVPEGFAHTGIVLTEEDRDHADADGWDAKGGAR